MKILSTAFQNNQFIPVNYTCDGLNISPPLLFSDILSEAQSLALIVEDPDAPSKPNFTHWVLYNIPPTTMEISEDSMPKNVGVGINDFGKTGYGGPCPPTGTHRYVFMLYALNSMLDLPPGSNKEQVRETMTGHIVDSARLVGVYERKDIRS